MVILNVFSSSPEALKYPYLFSKPMSWVYEGPRSILEKEDGVRDTC